MFTRKSISASVIVILGLVGTQSHAGGRLGYFGEHVIVTPGSDAAKAIEKDYPGRPKRKLQAKADEVRIGNVTIALPHSNSPPKPFGASRSPSCGVESQDSLTICLQSNGELPAADKEAAMRFLKEPTVVLVPTDEGRRTFEHLLAGDPALSERTELRALDPTVCSGECTSRIRLVRK